MNIPSLRINALTNDERQVSKEKFLLAIDVEDFWSPEIKQQLESINNNKVTELQLREFKKFAQLIRSDSDKVQNERIADKLVIIYFKERVKHPAKSTIQSSFNQSTEQDLIVACIKNEIDRQIEKLSTENSYHFISCLNEASQNFRPAIRAMGETVNVITTFVLKLIRKYDEQLQEELSPAEKNEVSFQLHCALQALIFCIKTHYNASNQVDSEANENLAGVVLKCVEFLDNHDLPMDTKNNCAMLIIMHSVDDQYIKWIKDCESSHSKQLCLIFGVVNTLSTSNIDFQLLADICTILENIFLKSSVEPLSMLSVCRTFVQLTKKLAIIDPVNMQEDLPNITSPALRVAFLNLEHHMDSIRHLSRETLKNLADFGVIKNSNTLIDRIFQEISYISTINLKSIVVLSISPSLKTSLILEKLPLFHEKLLKAINNNKVTNHNLINCYEALSHKSTLEIQFADWFKMFVQPAITEMMRHPPPSEERAILENLIVRFIKKEKKILDLRDRVNFDFGFVLLCLSTGMKTGQFDNLKSNDDQWKGIIRFDEIKKAMISDDDGMRISALMLIIESRKTTENFTQPEFDCIMFFLKYNINVQSPSTRQSILGLIKNLFVRIQSVLQLIIRKRETTMIEFYYQFLVQLQEFCLTNLFQGANFTRRTLSLRILFYIVEAFREHFTSRIHDIWSKPKFDILMDVLNDSYEANKEMAMEIMKFIPKWVIQEFTEVNLTQIKAMTISIKPPESLSASYLMEFMAKFALKVGEFTDEYSNVETESYFMLIWCEKLLVEGLETAEKSLIVASSTNPLYGLVMGIRHLLSKVDMKSLGACHLWRSFFSRLLVLCRRLTAVVAPVVNNSSPEGILPKEDFQHLKEEERAERLKIVAQTTSQIILLCSWRIIKEVSLLLGDISLKATLLIDGVGLLDVEQVLGIGDHFLELLSKTKHRGAFEQCFFGFSQLCLRLWTCHEPELHKLPSEMLQEMISSISGHDKENNELLTMKNLCATRRSAGLPFIIQALVTSELKVSTNKNFHFVMKNLTRFCLESQHLETRVHSLNILRALFRCSDLNEAIGAYISDGIKCAILGYGAESWIERNSSTLLFSSLMVRIFGVQRTKDNDDLGIRNKMTGRIFFLRYPELYDFFMAQLNEAAEYVQAVEMNAKLHPLLLLLIRLYPSSCEGSETNLTLSGFIPVVSRCSGCVEMQTRILCARFIAGILPPESLINRVKGTITVLDENKEAPANVSHGILLQILYLIKAMSSKSSWENATFLTSMASVICDISKRFERQLICYGTFLDIFVEICEKIWEFNEHFVSLQGRLDACISFEQEIPATLFGFPIVSKKIFLLELLRLQIDICSAPENPSFPLTLIGSEKRYLYKLQSMLNVILLLLDFDYAISMRDEYEIDAKEIFIVENMRDTQREKLITELKSSKLLKERLEKLLKSSHYDSMVKALDLLSIQSYNQAIEIEVIRENIQKALNKPEHYKKSLLKYAHSALALNVKHLKTMEFDFLTEISTDSSVFVKSVASDYVATLANNLKLIKSLNTIFNFSKSLLLLLMDDEHEIRERNSKMVMQLVAESDKYLPSYAQERFIEFLMDHLHNLDKYERMALLTLIAIDASSVDETSIEENSEYQVFDKNEVNIFSESLVIKNLCIKALKEKLSENEDVDHEISKIFHANQKFSNFKTEEQLINFLKAELSES